MKRRVEGSHIAAPRWLVQPIAKCYAAWVRTLFIALGFFALSGTSRTSASAQPPDTSPPSPIPDNCRQLLLVRTPSWSAVSGTLERYERGESLRWNLVGPPTPLNVGRSGMAWGRGLASQTKPGPIKREGDGRSPAGVFTLGRAFGSAEGLPAGARDFPYLQTLPSTYCVEDTRSKFYNQIVDVPGVTPGSRPGWSEMQRADGLFRWGVIVRQNDEEQVGAGSCVFLHIWRGAGRGTAGCTAMASDQIETTLRWLDAKASPLLVELPEPAYQDVRDAWGLP